MYSQNVYWSNRDLKRFAYLCLLKLGFLYHIWSSLVLKAFLLRYSSSNHAPSTKWFIIYQGLSWSYGCWILNYLCNQCLSSLMLWVQISIRARCTTLCDKFCQWLVTSPLFSPPKKNDCHDITEILLKVALNTNNHIDCTIYNNIHHQNSTACRQELTEILTSQFTT